MRLVEIATLSTEQTECALDTALIRRLEIRGCGLEQLTLHIIGHTNRTSALDNIKKLYA